MLEARASAAVWAKSPNACLADAVVLTLNIHQNTTHMPMKMAIEYRNQELALMPNHIFGGPIFFAFGDIG
jgi:hypothetical protein